MSDIRKAKAIRNEIETALRTGHTPEARRLLRNRLRQPVSRHERVVLARLLGRAGLAYEGMILLKPFVHPGPRVVAAATPEERIEYGGCLVRLGGIEEGEALLASVECGSSPEALWYGAMSRISRWEYAEAIAPLIAYGSHPGISTYQRYVAKVNLAAALIFVGDAFRAEALLAEVLRVTSLHGWTALLANALELSAEHFILRKRWSDARRCLDACRPLLVDESSLYHFLVDKWELILRFMIHELPSLDPLRNQARSRGFYETLRECDRFSALRDGDLELARHLYFGTPHRGYRDRLVKELPLPEITRSPFLWHLGPSGPPHFVFDLIAGTLKDSRGRITHRLRVGQLRHRVLRELARDFYRPVSATRLAVRLYREERHLQTFRYRIHEAVCVTRAWLAEVGLPLSIRHVHDGYQLHATEPVGILLADTELLSNAHGDDLFKLKASFGSGTFSCGDAVRLLALPPRTALRMLVNACDRGVLLRIGKGRYTRYAFSDAAETTAQVAALI